MHNNKFSTSIWISLISMLTQGMTEKTNVDVVCGQADKLFDRCFASSDLLDASKNNFLNSHNRKIPYSIDEINENCKVFQRGLQCYNDYTEKCMDAMNKRLINGEVEPAKNFYSMLCNDKEFKKDYLSHRECFRYIEKTIRKIELKSKLFNSEYSKMICIVCNDIKVEQINSSKAVSVVNDAGPDQANTWHFLKNVGFYCNPLVMRMFESFEIHIKNFSYMTFNEDMSIKQNVSHSFAKLLFDGYEKRFRRVGTKKELLFAIKNRDEKWKNFADTKLLPEFMFFVDKYKYFNVREDDVIISGFPRSGTTRAQEMVWLIVNDFDFEAALAHESDVRCPYFDHPGWSFLFRQNTMAGSLDQMPSPRTYKTHLPVQFLPDQVWMKKPKMIYVSRDVKDVAVSNYYFWYSMDAKRKIPMHEYLELFMNDTVLYGPYRETVQNYFKIPNYNNIMYITYEDMARDLDGTITRVAKFLGKVVSTENKLKLKNHLSFDNMKKNTATNNKVVLTSIQEFTNGEGDRDNFIRKGIVGDHKNVMSPEYINKFDKWYSAKDSLNQGFAYKKVVNSENESKPSWIRKNMNALKF